jgi:cytochrome c
MKFPTMTVAAVTLLAGTTFAFAASPPTKDAVVAMVKKAVALIKAEGPEKAYAEINKGGQFVDGEIYPIVQSLEGVNLANAINLKLVGKNMSEAQDVDGKYFVKDMTALASKQASFWYDFKFANPVTKKIQVKDMYCEVVDSTRVCSGLYRP